MKAFKLSCIFLLFSSSLFAQSEASINRYLALRELSRQARENADYWSVSLSGGGTAYWGEKDMAFTNTLGDSMAPFGKLTVARWFSSVWGLRLQVDGGLFKNYIVAEEEDPITKGEFRYMDGYLEVVTNVLNWGANKRSQRPISICILGGFGMAWTPTRNTFSAKYSPAAILGGQLNIRMTDYWSLALELDGTIVKDNFNSHIGGRKYEGWATVSVGLAYRFN